jgi:predicted ABC-type sugar transport system permease subunit
MGKWILLITVGGILIVLGVSLFNPIMTGTRAMDWSEFSDMNKLAALALPLSILFGVGYGIYRGVKHKNDG